MSKPVYDPEKVVEIIRILRSENGCPWDNEQTLETLRKYLLEETYEAIDAVDRRDWPNLCEELGDALWEILFMARIAEQEGHFTMEDIFQMVGEKMVRRHPHIFGEGKADDSQQVIDQWQKIKLEEGKGGSMSKVLKGIPNALPSLLRAQRISERVAEVGFDWENAGQVMEKFDEECGEFHEAVQSGDLHAVEDEMGDLLFTMVNVARHLGTSAEDALRHTTEKFIRRFSEVEKNVAESGIDFADHGVEALEEMWQASKKKVG